MNRSRHQSIRSLTVDRVLALIDEADAKFEQRADEFTFAEYAARRPRLSRARIETKLKRLVDAGILEVRTPTHKRFYRVVGRRRKKGM